MKETWLTSCCVYFLLHTGDNNDSDNHSEDSDRTLPPPMMPAMKEESNIKKEINIKKERNPN